MHTHMPLIVTLAAALGLSLLLAHYFNSTSTPIASTARATAAYCNRNVTNASLPTPPVLALVDGNQPPKLPCPVRCVIGGDAMSLSIAAASILAKVTRDRAMARLDRRWPGYGFASHQGYATVVHRVTVGSSGRTSPCQSHVLHRLLRWTVK